MSAFQWAAHYAHGRAVRIDAVCRWHLPLSKAAMFAKRGVDVDRLGMEAVAGHNVDEAIATLGEVDVEVEPLTIEGHPAQVLLDRAGESSLLILGRRGVSDLKHLVLGSVSRYCATHALVSVVVVPPGWVAGSSGEIVVGFDGSENSQAALRWAIEFAAGTPIRSLVAIDVAPWLDETSTLERFPDDVEAERVRIGAILDEVDPDEYSTRQFVLHSAEQALADASRGASLVVLGARGRRRHGPNLLGSVSSWMLHDATCPTVVVLQPA